jgi:hypothetical protein
MTTFTKHHSDLFNRALAAVAIIAPILLVIAASALPEGLARGELISGGCGVVLAIVATALALRTAYAVGFGKALKIASQLPNSPLTA